MKEKFIEEYNKYIKREGAKELLEWIESTDFFTAPASTRFHNSFEGGLVDHSLNVLYELGTECGLTKTCTNQETIAIVGLLHDLCKTNIYTHETRNKKINGKWEQVPYYGVEDTFPYGHGEKSVFLIERFMKLTEEEAVAIRFHMGPFEGEKMRGTVSDAFSKFPLTLSAYIADCRATFLRESKDKE